MTDSTLEKSDSDLTPLLQPRSVAVVGASLTAVFIDQDGTGGS